MDTFKLHLTARRAADDFLQKATSLDEAISKVAAEESLNPAQIQRVIEIANHQVNDVLRDKSQDKTYTFKVASYAGVREALAGPQEDRVPVTKLAEALTAIKHNKTAELEKRAAEFSASIPEDAELRKARLRATEAAIEQTIKIAESLKSRVDAALLVEKQDLGKALDKLAQDAMYFITIEKGKLSELKKYAQAAMPDFNGWQHVFEHVRANLEKLGHPYRGELSTDVELRKDTGAPSSGPVPLTGPITRVNGASPLYATLEPIRTKVSIVDALNHWKNEFDSLASSMRTNQRVLVDNASTDMEISRLTSGLMKCAQELLKQASVNPPMLRQYNLKNEALRRQFTPGQDMKSWLTQTLNAHKERMTSPTIPL